MTLSGEADRLPDWEPKAGVALFPLGDVYGPHWLLLGEDGRVFVGISNGNLDLLGHDLREAMETLTLGVVAAGLPQRL